MDIVLMAAIVLGVVCGICELIAFFGGIDGARIALRKPRHTWAEAHPVKRRLCWKEICAKCEFIIIGLCWAVPTPYPWLRPEQRQISAEPNALPHPMVDS